MDEIQIKSEELTEQERILPKHIQRMFEERMLGIPVEKEVEDPFVTDMEEIRFLEQKNKLLRLKVEGARLKNDLLEEEVRLLAVSEADKRLRNKGVR